MIASDNVDKKWCERKMEEDDRLRTLECLRGRLLAERAASRTAKEDAELMNNKLMELENKLKIEIKARNRAEKRLKFLKKRLESLKIPIVSEESEQSSSSDNSDISCRSSVTSSATKEPEETEPKPQIPSIHQEILSSFPQSTPSSIDSKNDEHSCSCKISAEADMIEDEKADNSLALVPVSIPATSSQVKKVDVNVGDVLAALRHAREKIQSSMETRHMIRVGSVGSGIC